MNPWLLVRSWLQRFIGPVLIFVVLFSLALSLGLALQAQERAIKQSSAAVSNPFQLLVGAPGSSNNLVLASIFLQPEPLTLVAPELWQQLQQDSQIDWFAPLVLGDNYQGRPVLGTTAQLVNHVFGTRLSFHQLDGAWVGADVPLRVGERFHPAHGLVSVSDAPGAHAALHVVQTLPATGTPWDRAIFVPVELSWRQHGIGYAGAGALGAADASPALGTFPGGQALPPVSAFVVQAKKVSAAYALRARYSNRQTLAVFPAEVMARLYRVLGDTRALLSLVTWLCQLLVCVTLLFALLQLLSQLKQEFAVLRVMGASRRYLLLATVAFASCLTLLGTALALGLAVIEIALLNALLSQRLGFAVNASLSMAEVQLALLALLVASALAWLPGGWLYRTRADKVVQSL